MDGLRAERKRRGWSTAYVAVTLGVSASTVDRWEAAKVIPEAPHLLKLAQLYGVEPAAVLDAIERQRTADALSSDA
jgi:transcriptional regulator with XRE-family HTH domain